LTQAGYAGSTWLARDVDGLPVWPGGWTGSISHSATAALAAVCPRATGISLGVDIEEIAPAQVARDVSSAVGRPDELAVLSKLPAALAVMLLFSAKESLYKALYPQLRTFRDFTAARLVAAEGSRFILRLEEDWGTRWPAGRLIQVHHAQRCGHVITAFQAF
jgi:enterobactin synthetase component D